MTEFVGIRPVGGVNWSAWGSGPSPRVTFQSRPSIVIPPCVSCFNGFLIFFEVKGSRPGKNVQLTEGEIRGLCLKSREIFLSQPILLELEAPLKICGRFDLVWDDPVQALVGAVPSSLP